MAEFSSKERRFKEKAAFLNRRLRLLKEKWPIVLEMKSSCPQGCSLYTFHVKFHDFHELD